MIRLIVTDVDRTLLDDAGELPPANRTALAAAHARGIRVALATVRKRDSAQAIAALLGIPCALACQSGATVYDHHGHVLRALAIPVDLARAIAAFADTHGIMLLTTINETNVQPVGGPPPILSSTPPREVATNLEAITGPAERFIVRGERDVTLMMQAFADAPLRFVRHWRTDGTLYDAAVTHQDATKAAALELLCRHYGISPANVLAIGDAESDIGMLQLAGTGVAVANAHPDVKAAADHVAPSNNHAGVAAAVQWALGEA